MTSNLSQLLWLCTMLIVFAIILWICFDGWRLVIHDVFHRTSDCDYKDCLYCLFENTPSGIKPKCPWCLKVFDTWNEAKIHIKFCFNSPHPRGGIKR